MRLLPLLLVAGAVLSAAIGAAETWPRLGVERAAWANADERAVRRAAAEHASLPPAPFEFFAARLTHSDRYYVHAEPPGRRAVADERVVVDEGTIVRLFAGYALLPAIQVLSPHDADVVVAYDADPRDLGVRLASVEEQPGPPHVAVARVER